MNASAPALSRDDDVQKKIRKVSTFARYARVVCSAVFGFGAVGGAAVLLIGLFGVFAGAPVGDGTLTPHQKLWSLPLIAVVAGLALAAVYQLYRLFGSLASGVIYTAENVGRVRRVGFLWLLSAIFSVLLPVIWMGLVAQGLVEPSDPPKQQLWFSWSDSLASFISAALILLVSWVMDVGLYEKDHADALRRDADLVI
jgi:hypothetical protein